MQDHQQVQENGMSYETPRLVDLGSLASLTQGHGGSGHDGEPDPTAVMCP